MENAVDVLVLMLSTQPPELAQLAPLDVPDVVLIRNVPDVLLLVMLSTIALVLAQLVLLDVTHAEPIRSVLNVLQAIF